MSVNDPNQPGGLKSFELEAEKLALNAIKGVEYQVRGWPALVTLIIVGVGLAILSEGLTIGPTWLWLVIITGLIVPVVITRLKGYHQLNHWLLITIGLVVTIAEATSILLLVSSLPDKSVEPLSLLRDAGILWVTNVLVFSLWYWRLEELTNARPKIISKPRNYYFPN